MARERPSQSADMMQEALDGQLSDEMGQKLLSLLGEDDAAARQFDQLRQLDGLLKRAPHQRAPTRLAATILARLARQVEQDAKLSDLPPQTQRLMMLSLSASMMAMMPMMEAASWLVLNAQRDPELLSEVMLQTIGWMTLVTEALIQLLDDAQSLARTQPEVATATLALTPVMLSSILDHLDQAAKQA